MCGIVAYIGNKSCQPLLLEGLKRLEYRGYDSAGIATLSGDRPMEILEVCKAVGKLDESRGQCSTRGSRQRREHGRHRPTPAGRRTAA